MSGIKEPTCTLYAARLYRLTQRRLDRVLEQYGLSSGTYPVLLCLHSLGEANQKQISDELAIDKALVARNTRRLVEDGYAERDPDPSDSRSCLLRLSDKGKQVVPRLREAIADWNLLLCEGMSPDRAAATLEALGHMWNNARRALDTDTQGEPRR